ncbi:hypothetical protein SOVF_216150 [Spinacia oleracea]|nr:hypothetical protein SOVF_216150 [Spinacia oleracea]
MFANNTQYQTNLNTLFTFLSSNSTTPTGFHQAVSTNGTATDEAVYGHFLCRGDQNATSCQDCVTTAVTIDLPRLHCPNRKEAIIWYDKCMVRYSNCSFFNSMDDSRAVVYWSDPGQVIRNETRFMELLKKMMNNEIAVRAALGGSQKKFSTGFVNVTAFQTIYGLGQCTPDLSPSDCNTCLETAVGSFIVGQSGGVMPPSCKVQYDIIPFFDLSLLPPPPPPSSPPSQPSQPPSSTEDFTHTRGKTNFLN